MTKALERSYVEPEWMKWLPPDARLSAGDIERAFNIPKSTLQRWKKQNNFPAGEIRESHWNAFGGHKNRRWTVKEIRKWLAAQRATEEA